MTMCLRARLPTLSMITTLDFRTMSAVSTSALNSPIIDITSDICSLSRFLSTLRCLILDGRADFDLRRLNRFLGDARDAIQDPWQKIAVLSLRDYQELGVPDIFNSGSLAGLVFLDLSCSSGWAHELQHTHEFVHNNLPNLRVLKLSQMFLHSRTITQIIYNFPFSFWSLDVSGNKLDDEIIQALRTHGVRCDVNSRLQNDGHFDVEGKLRRSDVLDGCFFIDESDSSAAFSHPLRYLADPPNYSTDDEEESRNRPKKPARRIGTERIRGDSVDDAITVLAGGVHDPVPVEVEWPSCVPSPGGLTHLYMNGLEVSLRSVQGMLGISSGYIEHFECDQAKFSVSHQSGRGEWLSKVPWLSSGTVLYGFPGSAYLFRPVYSSNLRVLKIHHSLVTNVPTVLSKITSALENSWIAEEFFHGPIDLAYPQTYVPDMNPRLYSLTLAKIPRHSPGVIAKRIINFLKLLAAQEQAIEQIKTLLPHRGPPVLRGLRHLCLEFDPEAQEEMASLNTNDDVDEAMQAFSSFSLSDCAWEHAAAPTPPQPIYRPSRQASSGTTNTNTTRAAATASSSSKRSTNTTPAPPLPTKHTQQTPTTDQGRLSAFPYTVFETEHLPFRVHDEPVINVWIGNGTPGPPNTPAVDAYMRALARADGQRFLAGVTLATPCHVAAGVPAGSYIFGNAWHRLAVPEADDEGEIARPTRAELVEGMRDVVGDIKAFRLASREVYARLVQEDKVSGEVGQHDYWKGRVEISLLERKQGVEVMYGQ